MGAAAPPPGAPRIECCPRTHFVPAKSAYSFRDQLKDRCEVGPPRKDTEIALNLLEKPFPVKSHSDSQTRARLRISLFSLPITIYDVSVRSDL